jgi:hypothetical protein
MIDSILKLSHIFYKLAKDKYEDLQPDDIITVYHGTSYTNMPMIHGVDATQEYHRNYGGPQHEGIFVTPDEEWGKSFAGSHGIVIEFDAKANDLFGTDYSGRTYKKQIERGMSNPNDLWRDKWPNSFSPYLSQTLSQNHEPQALFVGILSQDNIRRIYWKDQWYTLDEFFDSNPIYTAPYKSEGVPFKRLKFNPTDGDISLDSFYETIEAEHGYSRDMVNQAISHRIKSDRLQEFIENLGWVPSAAKKIEERIKEHGWFSNE